jgi:hypothetical protein
VVWVERLVRVEFGPSRSKRFGKAVAEAMGGRGECSELGSGRYRVSFALGEDADAYTGLARLLERVRHWRATDVYEDEEPVSVFHTREMGWCAAFQLDSFGECRERFGFGVLPRCGVCPLFDAERAIRAGLQPEPAPPFAIGDDADALDSDAGSYQIVLAPDLLEQLLSAEPPDWLDLSRLYPDTPPEEWGEADEDPQTG